MLRGAWTALLLIASGATFAACNINACDSTVRQLYPTGLASGAVYIQVADPITSLNCAPAEGVFLTLKPTHPSFKETYALLLSATQAKSPVRVRIAEGSTGCEVYYAWISSP